MDEIDSLFLIKLHQKFLTKKMNKLITNQVQTMQEESCARDLQWHIDEKMSSLEILCNMSDGICRTEKIKKVRCLLKMFYFKGRNKENLVGDQWFLTI